MYLQYDYIKYDISNNTINSKHKYMICQLSNNLYLLIKTGNKDDYKLIEFHFDRIVILN